jgi:hypothetical protein
MAGHKLRLQRIKNGLCGACGEPRDPKGGPKGTDTLCRTHADEHSRRVAESNARQRAERTEAGVCLDCGGPREEVRDRAFSRSRPRDPDKKLCGHCEDKRRQRNKRYYANLNAK